MSHAPGAGSLVRLTQSQVEEAGEVLARAFQSDPLLAYLEPNEAKRRRTLPWIMSRFVLLRLPSGQVYTTAGRVEGVTIWVPPGSPEPTLRQRLRAGLLAAPLRAGLGPTLRFLKFASYESDFHRRHFPPQCWYLEWLGVDPPSQGQGIGSGLLRAALSRADADGRPTYLETYSDRDIPFYRKHGFEVAMEDDLQPGGPHLWIMRRELQGP